MDTTAPPPWQPTDLPTLRAAYSDRTAALMAYLASIAYGDTLKIKGAISVVPPELNSLGFNRLTSFHNDLTDGWAYIAESEVLIVLAFRGTQSISNWETNFHTWLIHPPDTDPQLRVHQGFYNAFERLSDGTRGIKKAMEELHSSSGDVPVYITGHSLGGALAQIAAAVLGSDQTAACYTFGSPRVGNSIFDLWVKPPSYRVINYADIVPQVPFPVPLLFNYHHSGDPRYMPENVTGSPYRFEPNVFQRMAQLAKGFIQLVKAGSILGIEDHQIGEYCKKLNQIAVARTQSR
jgi:triacylglycerol lipase